MQALADLLQRNGASAVAIRHVLGAFAEWSYTGMLRNGRDLEIAIERSRQWLIALPECPTSDESVSCLVSLLAIETVADASMPLEKELIAETYRRHRNAYSPRFVDWGDAIVPGVLSALRTGKAVWSLERSVRLALGERGTIEQILISGGAAASSGQPTDDRKPFIMSVEVAVGPYDPS